MGKHLALWKVDRTGIPEDRKKRGAAWAQRMAAVRRDIEGGLTQS
jgi:hypothetical protein